MPRALRVYEASCRAAEQGRQMEEERRHGVFDRDDGDGQGSSVTDAHLVLTWGEATIAVSGRVKYSFVLDTVGFVG